MRRGTRGAESSGVLLFRLIAARSAVSSVRWALGSARRAGSDSACRRLRGVRASLGGVVRHLERLHGEACEREFRALQARGERRCRFCGVAIVPDVSSWVDVTGGDGCGDGVHLP